MLTLQEDKWVEWKKLTKMKKKEKIKTSRAFFNPKGMTLQVKDPHFIVKVVLFNFMIP